MLCVHSVCQDLEAKVDLLKLIRNQIDTLPEKSQEYDQDSICPAVTSLESRVLFAGSHSYSRMDSF